MAPSHETQTLIWALETKLTHERIAGDEAVHSLDCNTEHAARAADEADVQGPWGQGLIYVHTIAAGTQSMECELNRRRALQRRSHHVVRRACPGSGRVASWKPGRPDRLR
jgi:hypothetical protein